MTTLLDLIARFVHEFDASLLSTYSLEGRFNAGRGPLNFGEAESALLGILVFLELFASLANVIGLNLAVRTEVLFTSLATDSVLAHVNGRFP